MPVIAIVGAVSERCLAIARVFAARRFQIAFLAANPAELQGTLTALAWEGVDAAAFAADLRDPVSTAAALAAVEERLGAIDVLEVSASDAITAADEILPDMLARHSGTIILTTRAPAVGTGSRSARAVGDAVAAASARAWAHALHARVASSGVQVAHVVIDDRPGRAPGVTPEVIAPLYWELHTRRDQIEMVVSVAHDASADLV
jgi:NAD(P)-dependent dehydrogenase (short-subunit alcohol dehydrogenase family)